MRLFAAGKKKKAKSQSQKANGKGFANSSIPAPPPHSRVDYSKFENMDFDSDDDSHGTVDDGPDCDCGSGRRMNHCGGFYNYDEDVLSESHHSKPQHAASTADITKASVKDSSKKKAGMMKGFLFGGSSAGKASLDEDNTFKKQTPSSQYDSQGRVKGGSNISKTSPEPVTEASKSDDDDSSLPSLVTGISKSLSESCVSKFQCTTYHI